MTGRSARALAGLAVAVAATSATAATVIGLLHIDGFVQDWASLYGIFLAFAAVGWVIATRHPAHPVGWLLLAFGCLPLVVSLVQAYAQIALVELPGRLPAGDVAAWVGELPWGVIWNLLALVLLLFPTGRPASPRWRWVVRAVVANTLVVLVASAVTLWPVRYALIGPTEPAVPGGVWGAIMTMSYAAVGVGLIAGAASLVGRYRSGREAERAQLRWIALAAAGLIIAVAMVAARNVFGDVPLLIEQVAIVGIAAVPAAMGAAILRYRLYDIDRIISRTVSYVLLTVLLGAVYVTGVLLLSGLLAPLGAGSDLAVAGATLVAAAAFSPARQRIQTVVDRRFNRARYDAQREVGVFRDRLRDEVDLEQVAVGLVGTVHGTIQPAQASLWLRPIAGGPR